MSVRTDKLRPILEAAKKRKLIVRFGRPFEPGTFIGFIQSVGENFLLLAVLDGAFQFEHHTCLRIADVRNLEAPAKNEAFFKAARKLRGDKYPANVKVDLTNACTILRALHPSVVTIHFENITPDSCNIGVVTSDNQIGFEFLNIDASATWAAEPEYFRLNEITRIDLPGPYEKALLLVGGEPRLDAFDLR